MNQHSYQKPLLLIFILAILLRLPGFAWGIISINPTKFVFNVHDESQMANIASEFTLGFTDHEAFYPKGFPFQMALPAFILKHFMELDNPELAILGRLLSLLYAILTIFILFFLIRELTSNTSLALFSSLFLSLNELHISRSHLAMPDVALTFWMYALMYCSLIYLKTNELKYFILAVISSGIALSIKLPLMAVIPIIYILIRNQWSWVRSFLILTALAIIFYLGNGGKYALSNFLLTLNNVSFDNVAVREFNRALNPISYFFLLIYSFGLPAFVLTFWGFCRFISHKVNLKFFNKDYFFIIILPLLVHLASISSLAFAADRHLLPFIPLLCSFTAYGLLKIKDLPVFHGKNIFLILLGFIISYQIVHALSIEFNCVKETRLQANHWVMENIPKDSTIALPKYSYLPSLESNYKIVDIHNADYVVLHEAYYSRYTKTIMNPFTKYPKWENVFHGKPGEFNLIKSMIKGESPYKLIQRFNINFITPEMIFLRKTFGNLWDGGIGNVLIYKKL